MTTRRPARTPPTTRPTEPAITPRHHTLNPDGTPNTTALPADVAITPDGHTYMERYHLITNTARYHHFTGDDPGYDLHDHPWPSVSHILTGSYREHHPDGTHTDHHPGTTIVRDARTPHRLQLLTDDVWTLFLTGPIERRWGFHTRTGWVRWDLYPNYTTFVDLAQLNRRLALTKHTTP